MKRFLGRPRQVPVYSLSPGLNSLNACAFLLQVQPAVRHGLQELNDRNARHTLIEVALISYLMGMGFEYRTAIAIVESWESDETLLSDGILCQ
ncbi:hypothetical protein SDC9_22891 [bioreactor metagenome]|uniref:Uncharacterized protein n=1 Tax=bioreactor metagenome TaxID=1076179 RepID=A0A644UDU5_9ZZZZ|nr:hypothetical protein [Negativicutes bacterium]